MTFKQQVILTLIDEAAIGIFLLVAGFYLNRFLEAFKAQQAKILEAFKNEQAKEAEHHRWLQARNDEIAAIRRAAIADLARKLAAGNHNISWLTWKAKYDPKGLSREDIQKYDAEMHLILADLVGCRVNLAAIDPRLHEKLGPLLDNLHKLDSEIARTTRKLYDSPEECSKALTDLHAATEAYDKRLLDETLGIIISHVYGSAESAVRS